MLTLAVTAGAYAAEQRGPSFTLQPHHAGISVPDLEASIAWYHDMLGFEVVRRMEQAANPKMVFALLRRGDFNLELFQVDDGRPMPDYRRDPTADLYVHGTKHIAFEVDDARAAAAELAAKGADIALGPIENPRSIFVFIRDNAGNSFELIQPK
ncbi:MAG: VOC family protein [Gammaproteobacteria bacterium]|nr:VOC family protein [Gammaproteobacteria bacterium]